MIASASSRSHDRAPPMRLTTALLEDEAHPVSALLARRGEGAPTRIAELGGRRVGILPTIAYRKWLEAVLHAEDVDPSTVHTVPLPLHTLLPMAAVASLVLWVEELRKLHQRRLTS